MLELATVVAVGLVSTCSPPMLHFRHLQCSPNRRRSMHSPWAPLESPAVLTHNECSVGHPRPQARRCQGSNLTTMEISSA